MIVRNRLLNFGDNIIYQDDDAFLFSLDSVLLTNFVTIKLTDKKIIDLCSGNAPIPMLLSFRTKARIFGVELQEKIYDLGVKSIKENGMDKQISLFNYDVRDIQKYFDSESFDAVTCNPPYFKYNDDKFVNLSEEKKIARHEVKVNLEDIISKSKYLLKNGGTFAMVHRPERLIEIIDVMRKYNIEPKRIRFVYPNVKKNASVVLIEGIKNGKSGVKLLPPLITYESTSVYSDEVHKMFGSEENVAK